MIHLVYDSSYEGFLTAVFTVFEYRYEQVNIVVQKLFAPTLFGEEHFVYTDITKAQRVLRKIENLMGSEGSSIFLKAFISEEKGIETHLLEVVRLFLQFPQEKVLDNFGNLSVLAIRNAAKSVGREAHRMKEFVRFERVGDLYFAKISPYYDVLPLIIHHFKTRFSNQQWVLFDPERNYGFAYNLHNVIPFTPADKNFGKLLNTSEESYESLWKTYFKHINIPERKNSRYQQRNMPKRYWKYLPEMKN